MTISARALDAATTSRTTPLPPDRPISEQFRIVAKQWVDADTAASLLEELKTTTLERIKSDLIANDGPMPDNTATRLAKCSDRWDEYVREMCNTRSRANALKVQMEYIRMKFAEWQSAAATARAEMRL
jgi:hypothetical protein